MSLSVGEIASIADGLVAERGMHSLEWSTVAEQARSTVLRSSGLIAKCSWNPPLDFASEVEALELAERELPGTAPGLVAVDRAHQVIVMEDLGDGPSLADALLGDDEADARRALFDYADALIDVHDKSAHLSGSTATLARFENGAGHACARGDIE